MQQQRNNKKSLLLLQKSMIGPWHVSWIINYRCSNCANDKYKVVLPKKDQVKSIFYHNLFGLNICIIVASKVIIKNKKLAIQFIDLFIIWFIAICCLIL